MRSTNYNPRYVAYARAHGKTPRKMLAFDKERFPGGKMTGFIVWIGQEWRAWEAVFGKPRYLLQEHHGAFTAWVTARAVVLEERAWEAWSAAWDAARDEDVRLGRRYDRRIYAEKAHEARVKALAGGES